MDLSVGCIPLEAGQAVWRPEVYKHEKVTQCLEEQDTSESCIEKNILLEQFHYTKHLPTCEEHAELSPYSSYEDSYVVCI